MSGRYILGANNEPVLEPDLLVWGRWLETANNRHVARDQCGGADISTVFLGLDHGWGQGDPVLWETMIFGGEHDGYQERYTSLDDAVQGHADAVALAATSMFRDAPLVAPVSLPGIVPRKVWGHR